MAGDRKGVGIRVGLEGEDVVKRGFNDIANSGRKMFAEIALGAKSANPAIVALSRGSEEVGKGVQSLANRAGPATSVLSAFGVAGVGAAAALGTLTIAATQARAAMVMGDEIADTAAQLQIGTTALQEWRFAGLQAGATTEDISSALEGFSKKLGEARLGAKESVQWFERLGFTEAQIKGFGDVDEALSQVVGRIAEVDNAADRAAIAEKLGIAPLIPVINAGGDALSSFREEAHALGYVLDEDVIERLGKAQDESEALAKIIDAHLAVAFADLAPVLVASLQLIADITGKIGSLSDQIIDFRNNARQAYLDLPNWARQPVNDLAAAARFGGNAIIPGMGEINSRVFGGLFGIDSRGLPTDDGGRDYGMSAADDRVGGDANPYAGAPPRAVLPPRGGPARRAAGPKGMTAEEKAAGLEALRLEQDLAVARAAGNDALVDRLETLKFINEQAAKYLKLGQDEATARNQAEYDAMRRNVAAEKKAQDEAFRKGVIAADIDSNPNLSAGVPNLVIGPDGMGWSPEQRVAWEQSVADATVDGLDFALRGGDIFDYLKQQFYRAALDGLSNAITQAMAQMEYQSAGADGQGGSWLTTAFQFAGSLFGGQAQGRAAGGPMGQGYNFGEHGRSELGMFSNGYVADHEATQRMLTDAVGRAYQGGPGGPGGGSSGRTDIHVSARLEVPAGYIPDAQMGNLFRQFETRIVSSLASRVGPLATVQQAENFQLKG